MNTSQFIHFPVLLNNLIKERRLNPRTLSQMMHIQEKTVLNIISGRFPPSFAQIMKFTDIFPENKNDILLGGLHWIYLRRGAVGWNNFNIKHFIEEIIHDIKLPGKMTPYLIDIWKQLDDVSNLAKTELLIPPKPPLFILDSCSMMVREIIKNEDSLYKLHWREFEDLISYLLREFGWSVEPMGYTKDDNVDIIALKSIEPDINVNMMVQCKKYSKHRKVGMHIVREVWSTKWEKGFHAAMIVTSSFFTGGAMQKAQDLRLELKDHNSIVEWCEKYGKVVR